MLKHWKDESGVIMVEASIYFPIVIFTVFAMIYFGMVNYQESILAFQVQRLAAMGGKEVAYPGYEVFTKDVSRYSSAVDFQKGTDFSAEIKNYYDRHSKHLYNEWKFHYDDDRSRLEQELSEILSTSSFLTGVNSNCSVAINNYVIGRGITVKASYGLQSPKFLSIIGVPIDLTLKTNVTQSASNPVELVRDIDLATDLIDFLLERFGVKDRVDAFLKKAEDIKNKIL